MSQSFGENTHILQKNKVIASFEMTTLSMTSSTSPFITDFFDKFCGPSNKPSIFFFYVEVEAQIEQIIPWGRKAQDNVLGFFFNFLLVDKNLLQLRKQKSYPLYQNSLQFVFMNLTNKLVRNIQTKTQAPHKQNQTTKPSTDFNF